jgi:hypothetical protein
VKRRSVTLNADEKRLVAINNETVKLGERHSQLSSRPTGSSEAELARIEARLNQLRDERDALGAKMLQSPPSAYAQKQMDLRSAKNDLTKAVGSREQEAATRIQSALRGRAVRSKVVSADELEKYLKDNLKDLKSSDGKPIDLGKLSRALSREILEAAQDKNGIPKEGKRIFEQGKSYIYPVFDEDNQPTLDKKKQPVKEQIKLPVGLWLQRTPDGGIELEMIGQKLAEGTFKNVFRSRPLRIDLRSPEHKKEMQKTVLVQSKPGAARDVAEGLKQLRKFYSDEELRSGTSTTGTELRFAGLLSHMNRIRDASGALRTQPEAERMKGSILEARDLEMRGDLNSLAHEPVGDRLQAVADTGSMLADLHTRGGVHGDVKPENVLVDQGKPRGNIADFDGVDTIGGFPRITTEHYTDAIVDKAQALTPFTDIYALAKTASKSFFGFVTDDVSSFLNEANAEIAHLKDTYKLNAAQVKALGDVRDGIAGVLSENKQTMTFLEQNEQVAKGLRAFAPSDAKTRAMQALYGAFPAFRDFFGKLQQAQKAFQETK